MANPPASYLDPSLFADAAIPAETRQMNAALIQMMSGVPSWFEVGAPVVRELRLKGGSVFPPPVFSPRAKTIAVPGPAGPVSCRVITPEAAGAPAPSRGVYLHIHGGGWVLGAADQQDGMLERVADGSGLTVISVEYRLSPEHPYPAPADDCEAAALWITDHLAEHMAECPVLVIPVLVRGAGSTNPRAGASIYGAAQHLMLAARAFGIGSVMTTLSVQREEQVKALLGLPAEALTMGQKASHAVRSAEAGVMRAGAQQQQARAQY